MGQDISTSLNPPPLSLQDCLVGGKFNVTRYMYYRRKMDIFNDDVLFQPFPSPKKRKFQDHCKIHKSVALRSVKRHKLLVRNDDGTLRELTPQDTLWYLKYVQTPPRNDRLKKQFRQRFRMPYLQLHRFSSIY